MLRARGTSKLEVRRAGAVIIIRGFRKPPEVISEQNKVKKPALPVSIRSNWGKRNQRKGWTWLDQGWSTLAWREQKRGLQQRGKSWQCILAMGVKACLQCRGSSTLVKAKPVTQRSSTGRPRSVSLIPGSATYYTTLGKLPFLHPLFLLCKMEIISHRSVKRIN